MTPTENASAVENQAVDEPQASRFTWTIDNFSRLSVKKLYSEVFSVGSYKWLVKNYHLSETSLKKREVYQLSWSLSFVIKCYN